MHFAKEIAALVRTRVPLDSGLKRLSRDLTGRMGPIAARLGEELERGASFPEALESSGAKFPPIYRAVVEAGIRSGRLPAALETVAHSTRRLAEARRTVAAIRQLSDHVRRARREAELPAASDELRAAVEHRLEQMKEKAMKPNAQSRPAPATTRRRGVWIAMAVAVCLLVAAIPVWLVLSDHERTHQAAGDREVALMDDAAAAYKNKSQDSAADYSQTVAEPSPKRTAELLDGPPALPNGELPFSPEEVDSGTLYEEHHMFILGSESSALGDGTLFSAGRRSQPFPAGPDSQPAQGQPGTW